MALQFPSGCFFHIPKTGGSWVRSVLSYLPSRELVGPHAYPDAVQNAEGITFCFVRSPWTWLPSLFLYKLRTDPEYKRHDFLRRHVGGARTWPEFVDRYLAGCPGYLSRIYQRFASGVDIVGRTETLAGDLGRILDRCGHDLATFPLDTPRVNVSRRHPRWCKRHIPRIIDCERWIFDTYDYPRSPA